MKRYRSKLILTSLITLLPLFAGLLFWNQLPNTIATHFNTSNIPNGWSSKAFTVFAMPSFLLIIHLVCLFATLYDSKKENISRKLLSALFWMIPVISCITAFIIYGNALGLSLNPGGIINLMVAVVFFVIGNYMSKTHQNYTVGIRLPWTLNSTENWNRTHRLASKFFMAGSLAFLLNAYFLSEVLLVAIVLPCVLVPAIYSFVLYKKGV